MSTTTISWGCSARMVTLSSDNAGLRLGMTAISAYLLAPAAMPHWGFGTTCDLEGVLLWLGERMDEVGWFP